ncbi:MAG: S1C family serine protease [Dehalococcoidia bacterium]
MAHLAHLRSRALLAGALTLSLGLVSLGCTSNDGGDDSAAAPATRTQQPVANGTTTSSAPSTIPGDLVVVDLADVVDRVINSVVLIENADGAGSGSGIVIDTDGHILTNYHVIESMVSAKVTLFDGSASLAEVVGTDPGNDLAVIRADGFTADQLQPAVLGDSAQMRVGQAVFAIGNPFEETFTVTQGIVSALNRSSPSFGGRSIQGVLQTDAALNPGNSGGPLFNLDGEVIGINTSIRNPTGQSFAGLGFAVPSNTATRYLSQLIAGESIQHPQLGIAGPIELDQVTAAELGVSETRGLYMTTVVPEGPAARAGLQEGDVVIEINGRDTFTFEHLASAIDSAEVGDDIEIVVMRGGEEVTLTATLQPWDLS